MYLKNKQIFIVEDNMQNRMIFQMILLKHGASVHFERCGSETISRLVGFQHLDVIILDLMLAGGVSGYDIFGSIRSIPRFSQVPIVAVSAAEPAIAMPKVQALGFNGFIAKPVDMTLFPQQIAQLIEGTPVWHVGERFSV